MFPPKRNRFNSILTNSKQVLSKKLQLICESSIIRLKNLLRAHIGLKPQLSYVLAGKSNIDLCTEAQSRVDLHLK